uniref:Uncharacterized protein n=1 Tax=Macaca mulatta TaxID=9544 RepID=A0A5F8A517_MACMU
NPVSTKNTKISRAQWQAPVIPATWEAEAGESLEPGRWRLQRAVIVPLHSGLGDRVRLHLEKKKRGVLKDEEEFVHEVSKRVKDSMIGTPPVFINKVLLEGSFAHSFPYCLWLLLLQEQNEIVQVQTVILRPGKPKIFAIQPFKAKVC